MTVNELLNQLNRAAEDGHGDLDVVVIVRERVERGSVLRYGARIDDVRIEDMSFLGQTQESPSAIGGVTKKVAISAPQSVYRDRPEHSEPF